MGIKGRRVHMIEELSETIISFQRVNPGAKERLVQITGPTEEKINYAKQLIEDTIRRNASPVRLDPAMGGGHAAGGGSCSSLASSNSDDAVTPRTPGAGVSGSSSLSNRLSFNSAQNFMTASAAAAAAAAAQQQQVMNMMGAVVGSTATPTAVSAAGKVMRPNQQMLLHSFSTNDASLGEYKYTVNVGQHLIKITGDCCDLVRVAKLVLDDYFSSAEFLASVEAGAAFDGSIVSPISTPSTPMAGAPQFMMGTPLHAAAPPLADSGIGLNYMATQGAGYGANDGDDEVFADPNATSQNNGLSRSRRSHFSRKDSTPEAAANSTAARVKNESVVIGAVSSESTRIVHEYEHLLYYAKSPHSWALPVEWKKICEKFPAIVRNKVNQQLLTTTTNSTNVTNTAHKLRVASSITTNNITASTVSNITLSTPSPITISTALAVRRNIASNNNCIINDHSYTNATTIGGGGGGCGNNIVSTNNVNSGNLSMSAIKSSKANMLLTQQQQAMQIHPSHINQHHNRHQLYEFQQQTSLHIKRKGFFNRQIVSIDEEGYDALQQQQIQLQQQQYPTERYYNPNNTNVLTNTNSYYRTCNVQQQQQQRTDTNANNCNQQQQQQQIHYQQHLSQNQQQLQQQKPQLQQQYPQSPQQQYPQQQYLHNPQQQMISMRTGLTTCVPNYPVNIVSYSGVNPGAPPTNNITTTFHSNGNTYVASTSGNLENKPQKLLNKQIKMISSIMESTTQLSELAINDNQSTKLNESTNKQNKVFVENISKSSVHITTTNEKPSNPKFSDSTHKKRSSGGVDQKHATGATNVAANKKSDVIHVKKPSRKGRNKKVVQIVDGDETENWDTEESDVEFVSETKYIKPEIVITADVKANQRRATERPKFMRSNSTCN